MNSLHNSPTEQITEIRSKFYPRPYQLPILQALRKGVKRAVWCAHRRCGKDVTILNWCIDELVKWPCTCFYIMPTYNQAKKVIWDAITNDGQRILDYFPSQFIVQKNSQEMKIRFGNGSLFQLIGSENIDSLMGTNPKIVVFSEYALQNPSAWQFLSPILKVNGGVAVFISTPRGKNHFYNLFNYAKESEGWYCEKLTIDDTKVLSKQDVDQEIADGMPEEIALQEYYVSFERGIEGSYYGKLIQKCRDDGRISSINIDLDYPVHTGWDIGIGDSSAIWFFQINNGGNIVLLHYYENNNEGLPHFIQYLEKWKTAHNAIWGTHYVPHDMRNRDFGSGLGRLEVARNLGYQMTVVMKDNKAIPVDDGIQAVRSMLQNCIFNGKECKRGIDCLDFYRKKWNENLKVYYDEPLHDQYSHGADAFRTLATGLKLLPPTSSSKLSADKINDMRKKHYGY